MKYIILVMMMAAGFLQTSAQFESDWRKILQKDHDTAMLLPHTAANGYTYSYIKEAPVLWYMDDRSNFKKFTDSFLIKVEGKTVNAKRQGVFTFYLIDKSNPSTTYKLYEQSFKNDKLHGVWNSYSLDGKLFMHQNYVAGKLSGLQRTYNPNGSISQEKEMLLNGISIEREFYSTGTIMSEINFLRGKPHGTGKKFYKNGHLEDSVTFSYGEIEGNRYYYHYNGKLWIVEKFFAGRPWEIIANYDARGNKRDGGTLKEGTGTLIFYNEDDKVREIRYYRNGAEVENL